MKKTLLALVTITSLYSCSTRTISSSATLGTIQFEKKPDEIFTNPKLKKILKKESPSIIFRAPLNPFAVTQNNVAANGLVINTMEKEFMKAGFTVRDRGLFERVVQQGEMNYAKIKDLTNTDIVLEYVGFTPHQVTTNQYYTRNGKLKMLACPLTFDGYSIEFRAVYVKENEVAGSYKFYRMPCSGDNGCEYYIYPNCQLVKPSTNMVFYPYQLMTEERWQSFATKAATSLISEFKNQ